MVIRFARPGERRLSEEEVTGGEGFGGRPKFGSKAGSASGSDSGFFWVAMCACGGTGLRQELVSEHGF